MAAIVHKLQLALLNMPWVQLYLLRVGLCPQDNQQTRLLVAHRLYVALHWGAAGHFDTDHCTGASSTSLCSVTLLAGRGTLHKVKGIRGLAGSLAGAAHQSLGTASCLSSSYSVDRQLLSDRDKDASADCQKFMWDSSYERAKHMHKMRRNFRETGSHRRWGLHRGFPPWE